MKSMYGAPVNGIPVSAYEYNRICTEKARYSSELMLDVLSKPTESEIRLKESNGASGEYDFPSFRFEDKVFSANNSIHVMRHFRYDRHELHSHRFFEIVCVINGLCAVNISGRLINLTPGAVCLLSPGTAHSLSADSDDAIALKIIIRQSDFEKNYRELLSADTLITNFFKDSLYGEDVGWLLFQTDGDQNIRGLLLQMRYCEVRNGATDFMMKEALAMQLFCCLVSDHIENAVSAFGGNCSGKMLTYISNHLSTVTLATLAAEFHYTRNYISQLIKRVTGKPFIRLMNSLRIETAFRLLEGTDRPICRIAEEAGFGSKEYFHRKFRESAGVTPAEWRLRHRNASKNT